MYMHMRMLLPARVCVPRRLSRRQCVGKGMGLHQGVRLRLQVKVGARRQGGRIGLGMA